MFLPHQRRPLQAFRVSFLILAFILCSLIAARATDDLERLRSFIHQHIKDSTGLPTTATSSAFEWSKPVNGISARIEYFVPPQYAPAALLLGLKNEGNTTFHLPSAESAKNPSSQVFFLQTRRANKPWDTLLEMRRGHLHETVPQQYESNNFRQHPLAIEEGPDKHFTELPPGKSATLFLFIPGKFPEKVTDVRVEISMPEATENEWHGTLHTLSISVDQKGDRLDKFARSLDFPDVYPAFSRLLEDGLNSPPEESEFVRLARSNRHLLASLILYKAEPLRTELERRLRVETSSTMKLLLATEASALGSEPAALFLLDSMQTTDYLQLTGTYDALHRLISRYDQNLPAWVLALAESALDNTREVTGLEKTNWVSGTHFTAGYLADEHASLTWALGHTKCRDAVPFFINLAKREEFARGPVVALGLIGDARAVPTLLEGLEITALKAVESDSFKTERFSRIVEALSNIRSKEAVHALLRFIVNPDVIEALERIGDARALPALQRLVTARGEILRNGKPLDASRNRERLVAAKIALASMDQEKRDQSLCSLLSDSTFKEFDRRSVVWRLGDKPNPKAIPTLIKLNKSDASGVVINQSITVLSVFKYPAAVTGLMECFDTDFKGKNDWKRAYTPDMFRQNIADTLNQITGQHLPPDKGVWLQWWRDEGHLLTWMHPEAH